MGHTYRYKWVVLAASLYITTFIYGLLFTFGSLLNDLLDKFHENRSKTATLQAILIGVGLSTGLLSGILISRFGIFKVAALGAILCPLGLIFSFLAETIVHLYISIGVITGFGISLMFISSTTAIGMSFEGSQRLLALAIQNSGISLAGITLPHCLNFLTEMYGLNGTFLVLGGVCLNCLPIARIFAIVEQDKKEELKQQETHGKTMDQTESVQTSSVTIRRQSYSDIFKYEMKSVSVNVSRVLSVPYFLTLIAVGITIATLNAHMSLLLDILRWKGFTASEALIAFPVAYGCGLGARLLPGVVKQCNGVNSLTLPIVYTICGGAGQVIIYSSSSLPSVLIGCGLTGIAVSGVISAANIVVVQIVGQQNMSIGIGLINTAIGVSSAALGPAFGAIRDSSGSYGFVLQLTAGVQLVGVLLFIITVIARKRCEYVDT